MFSGTTVTKTSRYLLIANDNYHPSAWIICKIPVCLIFLSVLARGVKMGEYRRPKDGRGRAEPAPGVHQSKPWW